VSTVLGGRLLPKPWASSMQALWVGPLKST